MGLRAVVNSTAVDRGRWCAFNLVYYVFLRTASSASDGITPSFGRLEITRFISNRSSALCVDNTTQNWVPLTTGRQWFVELLNRFMVELTSCSIMSTLLYGASTISITHAYAKICLFIHSLSRHKWQQYHLNKAQRLEARFTKQNLRTNLSKNLG